MSKDYKFRIQWIRFMYLYTAVGAGITGLMMLVFPSAMTRLLSMPMQDPFILGVMSSSFMAFGLISILGLRAPLKYISILFLQMVYKCIWFVLVVLPAFLDNAVPAYMLPMIIIFATFITGDFIALPFRYLFIRGDMKGIPQKKVISTEA